ncbi:MAG: hypothetical protein ABI177_07945 [Edaphobacter sp.]
MMKDAYSKMGKALRSTRLPIVYSISQDTSDVWRWGTSVGANLWRTTSDIKDSYALMAENGFSQAGLSKFSSPGHWNDPDMLEVGNGGMSLDEYQTHMSLWAILAATLLAGNDLTKMTPETALTTTMDPHALGFPKPVHGRDVWRHQDLPKLSGSYTVTVPGHGVLLLRIRM